MRNIIILTLIITLLPFTVAAGDNYLIHASDGTTSINGTDICVDIFGTPLCLSDAVAGAGINTINAGSGLFGGGSGSTVTINVSADTCGVGNVSKYNGTGFECVVDASGGGGGTGKEGDGIYLTNDSTTMFWDVTLAGTNLSVNSSDFWDDFDTANTTWFENIAGVLNLKLSELTSFFDDSFSGKTTDDLTEGSTNRYDNQTFNQPLTDFLYVNIDGDTMTGDLNFSNSGIYNASFISLNTTQSDPAHLEGLIFYDQDALVPSFYTTDPEVKNSLGLEIWKRVRNTGGVQIYDGDAVYIKGSTGQVAEVGLAISSSRITSGVIGLATEVIANNDFGWITVLGDVHNLNTSAFNSGDMIYLSDTIPGSWTNIAPTAPNFAISIGEIINSHVNQGIISVRPSPTDVLNHMVIQDLSINNNLTVSSNISTGGFYIGDGSLLTNINSNFSSFSNSSDYWDDFNTANTTWFENIAGVLNLKLSELTSFFDTLFSGKTTDDLTEGSTNRYNNNSFNVSALDNVAGIGDCPTGQFVVNTTTGGVECDTPTSGDINATSVLIALGSGSPTVDQLQEYLDNTGSSGFFTGGELSDGGAGTLDVAAGSGFIRTTNDDNAELQSFKWSASSGIAVPDDTTQYVYVDDVGVISLSQNEFLEAPDLIKIGVVTDVAGVISHTFALGVRLEESVAEAGRFIRRVHGISRDNRRGGLIMGQSGDANRDVTLTAGSLWWGRTEYIINSFDTSGVDTFTTYSANGLENSTASQFPNTQYDNAGTLTTMSNNRWANLFFYLEPDNHITMVYGRGQFTSEALAENEGVPSTLLPSIITETSILVARYTFQESSNTATISSAFDSLFANAGVTDHGNLAGLADDDHPQYILDSDEANLNVNSSDFSNSSDFWDDFDTANTTWFENIAGVLSLKLSELTSWVNDWFGTKTTDDLTEGSVNLYDNQTFNQPLTDGLYADISVTGDNQSWNEPVADAKYLNQTAISNLNMTDGFNITLGGCTTSWNGTCEIKNCPTTVTISC